MPRSKDVARQHAVVAATARFKPNSAEHDAARRDLKALNTREYIQRVISTWPPLSDEQRTRLAELLAPAREAIRQHRLTALESQEANLDAAYTTTP
jgi:hypothetical protein